MFLRRNQSLQTPETRQQMNKALQDFLFFRAKALQEQQQRAFLNATHEFRTIPASAPTQDENVDADQSPRTEADAQESYQRFMNLL